MQLTDRELAAVLAGLRTIQDMEWITGGRTTGVMPSSAMIENLDGFNLAENDIATDGERFGPLTAEEIDALCEKLNTEADVVAEIDYVHAGAKGETPVLVFPDPEDDLPLLYLVGDIEDFKGAVASWEKQDGEYVAGNIGEGEWKGFSDFMAEHGYTTTDFIVAATGD